MTEQWRKLDLFGTNIIISRNILAIVYVPLWYDKTIHNLDFVTIKSRAYAAVWKSAYVCENAKIWFQKFKEKHLNVWTKILHWREKIPLDLSGMFPKKCKQESLPLITPERNQG
jgi:hypothetical protein